METLMSIVAFVGAFFARLGLFLAIPLTLALLAAVGLGLAKLVRFFRRKAVGVERVAGLQFRSDLHYAPGHTWAREADGRLKIGLDDLARRLLPEPSAVELPEVGRSLGSGDVAVVIVCGNRRVEIRTPAGGKIVAANGALALHPGAVHEPYGRGWLFELEPADQAFRTLPTAEQARAWMKQEGERLSAVLERDFGVAAADGGEFMMPLSHVGDAKWEVLARAFLGQR